MAAVVMENPNDNKLIKTNPTKAKAAILGSPSEIIASKD